MNLSVLGAGQWHHQRDVEVSIRDYDYFGEGGQELNDGKIDRRWNSNGGMLDGEEFGMRRNFYNKPLATFNWDWTITENLTLNTSLYGSAGRGGGTGPRGRNYDILPLPSGLVLIHVRGQHDAVPYRRRSSRLRRHHRGQPSRCYSARR